MTSNFSQTLAGSANDASEALDGTAFNSTFVNASIQSAAIASLCFSSGFRFTAVSIAKNSHILAATIQLYSAQFPVPADDDPNMDIYAEAADNSVDFVTTASVVSRALTSASVSYSATNVGTGYVTPADISALIQEVVNRASWASGNALTILCRGKNIGSGSGFNAWAADKGNGLYAILSVTYEGPYVGPARTPVIVRQAPQRTAVR